MSRELQDGGSAQPMVRHAPEDGVCRGPSREEPRPSQAAWEVGGQRPPEPEDGP